MENALVEVEYRSGRIGYFRNTESLEIIPDSWVIVQVDRGVDIARVINTQVEAESIVEKIDTTELLNVVRNLTEEDDEKLIELEEKEEEAHRKFLELVVKYPFEMKLIKTNYQYDLNKLTFFFTADGRVDFREFVRELASNFRTRIELHQTTGRDVAKQLGGIGMCGKNYCCATFLRQFSQITIKMAKDQNLSGNLSKISGPCGRLLCCLHYEENYYMEISRDFPEVGEEVTYEGIKMYVYKNDFYNKKVHLASEDQISEVIDLEHYHKISRRRFNK